jgi:2',3'-cyclic-nucleotide 2'-phosphodiesterase / 3'-nucleotidase
LSLPGASRTWPLSATQVFPPAEARDIADGTPTENPVIKLRFIATSDLHACLLPYDYCANRPAAGRGLGEIARQIVAARTEAPNSMLFDNGDFLQGSPLADFVASVERRRRAHPVITAFNTLGYDAVTLGNHDFDYGLGFLTKSISQARFPIISANVATRLGKTPSRDQTFVPPFALLRRRFVDQHGRKHSLRVGVIGFAPPQIEVWVKDRLEGRIRMRDILSAARDWLPKLKAAGADVILALVHSGIGSVEADDGTENAATALAALPEVDAVIAGHSHQIFPGPGFSGLPGVDPVRGCLAGKPAVMPGHSGSHIGIIDLQLARTSTDSRKWRIIDREVRLNARSAEVASVVPQFQRAIVSDHRATLAWSRRSLGQSRVPLTTYFATVAPTAAIELIAAAKVDHVRRALAGTALASLPVLASVTPFRAGGLGGPENFTDISAGPFRMRDLSGLYPFPNAVVTLALTAADVADRLERSATIFRQIQPGESDAPLHNPDAPAFSFDCIPGIDYAIDLSQPARFDVGGTLIHPQAQRIVGLSLNGRLLDPAEPLLLVTNNHRASRIATHGGIGPQVVLSDGVRVQAILAEYIRAQELVAAPPRRNWHFLPMPGTSVRIATGSRAAKALGDVAAMRPEPLLRDAQGFLHYRLHL